VVASKWAKVARSFEGVRWRLRSKVVMLARRELAFMTWARHSSETDEVVTYGLKHEGRGQACENQSRLALGARTRTGALRRAWARALKIISRLRRG
jgi:hypothetical protein